jgi:serine protease Do
VNFVSNRTLSPNKIAALILVVLILPTWAAAQAPAQITPPPAGTSQSADAEKTASAMQAMSGAFESLVRRVSPCVVEIMVTGFGSPSDEDSTASSAVGRERSLGSGVIISPDGYIVTNHHVVKGADRVRVLLTPSNLGDSEAQGMLKTRGKVLPAKIVGVSKLIDLAILKVDASNLPTLELGRYDEVRKGQIVLAFGSPQGLENSVSFGLVSSVLRQPDPDDPMVYIQTDAAINPGNSGGPLVNVDGKVVGINTFIYTKSGGNEGIGFAIPSGIVRYAYEQIRRYGRVRRRSIGADLQSVSLDLTQALGLPADTGVIVSDVFPDSPAAGAGLKIGDVIVGLDGLPVQNVALFTLGLYLVNTGDTASLKVLRGDKKLDLTVPVFEPPDDLAHISDLADPTKDIIPRLGILGVTITRDIANQLGDLRIPSGVLVASIVDDRLAVDSGLEEGDIIHSLNHVSVTSVESLRAEFNKLQPGQAAAMQVERSGKLTYVTFEME